MSRKPDRRKNDIYCDQCGEAIEDISKCKVYKSGPPYYENIYICEECANMKKEVEDDGK